jgi:hypothetical protein
LSISLGGIADKCRSESCTPGVLTSERAEKDEVEREEKKEVEAKEESKT